MKITWTVKTQSGIIKLERLPFWYPEWAIFREGLAEGCKQDKEKENKK